MQFMFERCHKTWVGMAVYTRCNQNRPELVCWLSPVEPACNVVHHLLHKSEQKLAYKRKVAYLY